MAKKPARSSYWTYVPIAAAVVIMGYTCIVQGRWSERWGTFPELERFANQLNKIPDSFGDWDGKESKKTDESILKVAGAEGEFVRNYENRVTGQQVHVSIICARLQHIFNHTPERCYPAAGFEMLGEPQKESFEMGDRQADFFTTTFSKSEPTGTHLEKGFWSWTADGQWIAPKNSKVSFAGQKALYKLYVFASVPAGNKKSSGHEFYEEFIREFIPVLDDALRPAFTDESAPAQAAASEPTKPAA